MGRAPGGAEIGGAGSAIAGSPFSICRNGRLQPMASGDGRYVVTFNGEIYNYPSLRKELEAEGVVFRSTSDTEVLLHLFARDGATMVHRLRGMYAFAIWDSIARRLFLARDPYGIKPLYTANDGWTFRFASQVKALLAGGAVSRDPEPAGLVGFHLFGSVPEPFTLYREIRALPAGHSQWVDAAGPREPEPFARLAAILADGARKAAPASELRERVRVGVSDSVRAHLLADVEVGIFLSAGVDSGSLLGLMRDAGQSNVRAITLAFEEFAGSHGGRSAACCARRPALWRQPRRATCGQEGIRRRPACDFRCDGSALHRWREHLVCIEGGEGSRIESGALRARWRRASGRLSEFSRCAALAPPLRSAGRRARGSDGWRAGSHQRSPRALPLPIQRRSACSTMPRAGLVPICCAAGCFCRTSSRRSWMPTSRAKACVACGRSGVCRPVLCPIRAAMSRASRCSSSTQYMRNQLLRDADWAGMAHGVEIRLPLVDTTLLETLSAVIGQIRPGAGKLALAAAPSHAAAGRDCRAGEDRLRRADKRLGGRCIGV